ncbi:MAG: 2-dehydro-3-deoxy-D-gluconate 5-dehydrogenase KduD [Promicromonosporaceae bacterium]|nr:2-dehydro-3-deoxy-D-gluconate 5-dehydrogenase KduD [Promicromonosporaceae bacterium]
MILDSFKLDGRVAIVTGGHRGLGQAAALALAEAGADVAVLDFGDASETVAAVEALGRRALFAQIDLIAATPAEIDAAVADVAERLGGVDILVNNAGIIRRTPAAEHAARDWDEVIAINQTALFHLCQAAGRLMLAQGHGKIINIASMLSFQGGITVPGYAASKHAVAGITKALANEWAGRGVGVNAIAPGYMSTDNTAALRADEARNSAILDRIPAGRWGVPADLAGTFVYLASPASDYLAGAIIPVDGGWLVR